MPDKLPEPLKIIQPSTTPVRDLGPLVLVEGMLMVADSETFSPAEEKAARALWRKHAGRPGLIDAEEWVE